LLKFVKIFLFFFASLVVGNKTLGYLLVVKLGLQAGIFGGFAAVAARWWAVLWWRR